MKFFAYFFKNGALFVRGIRLRLSQQKPFSEKEAKPLFYGQHDTFSENRSLGSGFSKNTSQYGFMGLSITKISS